MKRARIHDRYRSQFCVCKWRRKTYAKRMLEEADLQAHLCWMSISENIEPPSPEQWYGGIIPEAHREDWLPPETPACLQRSNTPLDRSISGSKL